MELDYDEDVGEEDGRGYEDKEKIDDSRVFLIILFIL